MVHFDLKQLNVNETELKAFIHQKINEIQKYSLGAPVAMNMKMEENQTFTVKIVTQHEVGEVHAEDTDKDLFVAIAKTKTLILDCLHQLSSKAYINDKVPDDSSNNEVTQLKKAIH